MSKDYNMIDLFISSYFDTSSFFNNFKESLVKKKTIKIVLLATNFLQITYLFALMETLLVCLTQNEV